VRLVLAGVALASAFAIAAPAQAALPAVPDPAAAAQQTLNQTVGQAQQQVDQTLSQTSANVPQAKPVVDVVKTVESTAKSTVDRTVAKVSVAPTRRAQPPAASDSPPDPPSSRTPSAPSVERKPSGGALGAVHQHANRHRPAAHAPVAAERINDFQAASARPPAAEVGGRPVSLRPRTAPAPAAGGATALPFSSSSSGGFFVPFLALLVLAALAMPRLLRRLDGPPAFVRPEPFLCALERPG
jgi:hypothetical protein